MGNLAERLVETKTVLNTSGLEPVGEAVLTRPYDAEMKKGLIIIPESAKEGRRMGEIRATVIAIGSEAWKKESRPRAKVGDKVLISKFVGALLTGPADGLAYKMVNGEDIYAVITKEKADG
jgi:co-chaperonin GroES (HSP10)